MGVRRRDLSNLAKTGAYTVVAYYYGEWKTPGQSYNKSPWKWFSGYKDRIPSNSEVVETTFSWPLPKYSSVLSVGNATAKDSVDGWTVTSSGADPIIYSPDSLSVPGANCPTVSVRLRRLAGSGWQGDMFFITNADQTYSESKKATVAQPTWDGGFKTVTFNPSASSLWTSETVKRVRFDFGTTSSDVFELQSVTMNGVGVDYAGCPGDSQESVLREIDEAWNAGIDVFACNFYWTSPPGANFAESNTWAIRDAGSVAPEMKYCISWANHGGQTISNLSQWHALIDYWVENHFWSGRYWKKAGKPVVMVFNATNLSNWAHTFMGGANSRDSLKLLIDDANTYYPGGIHFVSEEGTAHPYWTGRASGWVGANDFAGFLASTLYNAHNGGVNQVQTGSGGTWQYLYSSDGGATANNALVDSYDKLTQCYDANTTWVLATSGNTLPFWPPVTAGWSTYPWDDYQNGGVSSPHSKCIPSRQQWVAHLQKTKDFLDAYPSITERTCVIYAWNEYGEGGWLNPGPARPDWHNAIREVFGSRTGTRSVARSQSFTRAQRA